MPPCVYKFQKARESEMRVCVCVCVCARACVHVCVVCHMSGSKTTALRSKVGRMRDFQGREREMKRRRGRRNDEEGEG